LDLLICQGVGFGNDRDKINLGVQTFHEFDVDGSQPGEEKEFEQYITCHKADLIIMYDEMNR